MAMSAEKLNRRQWLGRLCAFLGAAVAGPWLARAAAGTTVAAQPPVAPVDGFGAVTTFVYAAGGMLAGAVNPGHTTTFTYQADRLLAVRDAAGNEPPLPPRPPG
jgi:YD repeat-containing protein